MNTGLKYAGTLLGGMGVGGLGGYAAGQNTAKGVVDPEEAVAVAYMTIKSQNPEMDDNEAIQLAIDSLSSYNQQPAEVGYEGM